MSQKQYSEAARAAETAVAVRPENPYAWYSLAVAQAAAGNTKRALEALEQAAAKGFRGWDRADAEPLLAKVRKDARYQRMK
jgi:tetratricopeptide (TPR) repeat protein